MEESITPHTIEPLRLVIGFLMSLAIAVSSFRLRVLDTSGCIALMLMGSIVFGIGGWPFSAPILFFFIISAAWTTHPASPGYKFGGLEILILSVCGVLAHFLDSIFGATVQAQYLCTECGSTTERLAHCQGSNAVLHRGLKWMNNDVVNGFCALSGAMLVYMMI